MKKLLTSLVICTVLAGGAFALSFEASAGGAYGFTSILHSDDNYKYTDTDNSWGAKAAVTANLNKNLGVQFEGSFLWPTKVLNKKTNKSSGKRTSNANDRRNAFIFNGFIGPVYNLSLTKDLTLRLGAGFDIAYNQYASESTVSVVYTTTTKTVYSYWSYGIGARADAIYKINKNLGLKIGVTGALLWPSSYKTEITTTSDNPLIKNDSESITKNFENYTGLYLIPDISFTYRF